MRTHTDEHDRDPIDMADAFFVMEDGTICVPQECLCCLEVPCVCANEEAPRKYRNYRPVPARRRD